MTIAANMSAPIVHKRKQGRIEVRLPAKLVLMSATHAAILNNLSRKGAKLSLDNPPPRGSDAVLRWGDFEAFGTISWVSGRRCGILFLSPLPEEPLRATLALNDAQRLPEDAEGDLGAARAWVEGTGRLGLD